MTLGAVDSVDSHSVPCYVSVGYSLKPMVVSRSIPSQPKVDPLTSNLLDQTAHDLTCIEFFSGIGLTHLGLCSQGWN